MAFNAKEYIEVIEQSSVGTPVTGRGRFYFKDDGLPYVKDDNGTEQELSTGGSAGISKQVTQSSHGFAVGDVIRFDGADYVKAKADSDSNAEVLGIVSLVTGVDDFTVTLGGFCTLAGQSLNAGDTMFLSEITAGLMTVTEPSEAGEVVKPVFLCVSATTGYLINWRGNVVAAGVITADTFQPESSADTIYRVNTIANGDQVVTGIGFQPTSIHLVYTPDSANAYRSGVGFSDGNGNNKCVYRSSYHAGSLVSNGSCIEFVEGGSLVNSATATFQSDGFTLSWVKTGSPTDTIRIGYMVVK
jgi:hypothetical protein